MSGTAEGHGGVTVTFDGNFLSINRKGFLARATVGKGEKRIPLGSITAVQLKPAGAMVNGFIQFTVAGGNEAKSKFGSQTMDAVKDENSVVFTKKQQAAFEALRDDIEQAITARHTPQAPQAAAAPDLMDQLGKLAALRDSGVLTDDEFAAQKARLLA
jgi:hypothetical protein